MKSQNKEYKTLESSLGQIGIDYNPTKLMKLCGLNRDEVIALQKAHADKLYQHYVKRQQRDIDILNDDKLTAIPDDIDYNSIGGLSNEVRTKLVRFRPKTILEMRAIEGITPSAVIAVQIYLRR